MLSNENSVSDRSAACMPVASAIHASTSGQAGRGDSGARTRNSASAGMLTASAITNGSSDSGWT